MGRSENNSNIVSKASEKQGFVTLEDLLWEHQDFDAALLRKFRRFLKELIEKSASQYDSATKKIIVNTIRLLHAKSGILPSKVYIQDFNRSNLNILYVFPKAVFEKRSKELYELMPEIQDTAVSAEDRDFEWHFTSDQHLNEDLLDIEFNYSVKL